MTEPPSPPSMELARSQVKPTRNTTATARSGPVKYKEIKSILNHEPDMRQA